MKKIDYYLKALAANADYRRVWMLQAFTVVLTAPGENVYAWSIRHLPERVEVYVPQESGSFGWEVLEGAQPYQVPFIYHEETGPIAKGAISNLDRNLENSTYGDLLVNHRVLCYGSGNIIPFMEGPFSPGDLEKVITKRLKDTPPAGEWVEGELYTVHLEKIGKAIGDLCGYEFFIPSVTEKSISVPPGRDELRDKLFAENEGRLDDPVVHANIQNALVDLYKENLKGDPAEGFIYKKKTLNTAIKRMLLIHGPEAGFTQGGRAKLIKTSLQEGIRVENWPDMNNSLRNGAYSRGALTALAGTDVDLIGRIFQDVSILDEFCGTKRGISKFIERKDNGHYIFEKDGSLKLLTDDNLNTYLGKRYQRLSPGYCRTKDGNHCRYCMGEVLSSYRTSAGAMASENSSDMMYVMMGSAHAKDLQYVQLDTTTWLG